jgi:pimeloyl-ACP methyl ester carboxylesterase
VPDPTSCSAGPEVAPIDGARPKIQAHPQDSTPRCAGSNNAASASATLVDLVPDLVNTAGTAIITKTALLARLGRPVTGIAADGAARLVIRVYGSYDGQKIALSLHDDGMGDSNGLPDPDGTLATTTGANRGTKLTVTTTHLTDGNTDYGFMAFAQYFPPPDFSRGGADDSAQNRVVTLQLDTTGQTVPATVPITIYRPPLVLVHGIWGEPGSWYNFQPLIGDARFSPIRYSDYSKQSYLLDSSNPAYDFLIVATGADLGLAPNAPFVRADIRTAIEGARTAIQGGQKNGVAVLQADVVAHSMGGIIVRKLEYDPTYADKTSFRIGLIHKLITIGTPHFGSPLASQLLATPPQPTNSCMRRVLTMQDEHVFQSVTITGGSQQQLNGGVGDLQGDGTSDPTLLSPALQSLEQYNPHEAPIAMIAGIMTPANTNNIKAYWKRKGADVYFTRYACPNANEPLINALLSGNWVSVFDGQSSDAVVPLLSEANSSVSITKYGVIHSSSFESLGFSGPSELDSDAQTGIPSAVIHLLNTPVTANDFHHLTQ